MEAFTVSYSYVPFVTYTTHHHLKSKRKDEVPMTLSISMCSNNLSFFLIGTKFN